MEGEIHFPFFSPSAQGRIASSNKQEDRPFFESFRIAVIFSGKGNRRVH